MTREQEIFAELILKAHKENGGRLSSDSYPKADSGLNRLDSDVVQSRLVEMELIEYMDDNRYRTRITEKGEDFPGFDAYNKKKADDLEKQELIQDYTLNQLIWAKRKAKYWWAIFIAGLAIGVLSDNFEFIIDMFSK